MSKVLRTYASIDVVEAARRRIRNVFSNGCKVYLSFSGGKDSLCLAQLVWEELATGAINPAQLTVVYVDEEGMFPDIIEIVKHWRKRFLSVGAGFEWLCLEFKHFSCLNALTSDESFILWDRNKADLWIRTPPPFAIMRDDRLKAGQETYQSFLARTHADGINMDGVRISPERMLEMSQALTGLTSLNDYGDAFAPPINGANGLNAAIGSLPGGLSRIGKEVDAESAAMAKLRTTLAQLSEDTLKQIDAQVNGFERIKKVRPKSAKANQGI